MEGFSILGLNFPVYITATLLLSYIVWSKFLKSGKLGLDSINDLLDIFSIFIFLFGSLVSMIVFVVLVVDFISLNVDLQKLLTAVPSSVALIAIMCIWALMGSYRHKRGSKEELKVIFIWSIRLSLFFIVYYLGYYLLILFTPLRFALWDLGILFVLFVAAIFFCYSTVNRVLFEVKFFHEVVNGRVIAGLIACLGLVCIIGFLLIPLISYSEPINGPYYVLNPDPVWGEAFLKSKLIIDIKTFGYFDSISPIIPIKYGPLRFETDGQGGKSFKIFVNSSLDHSPKALVNSFDELKTFNERTDKWGFTGLFHYDSKKLVVLKFDKSEIKKKEIHQLIVEGYVKKNLSEVEYSYSDNTKSSGSCNTDGCEFVFKIKNNLDLPVHQDESGLTVLSHMNLKDSSRCKFKNVSSDFVTDGSLKIQEIPCNVNSCELTILDTKSKEDVFSMLIYLDEGSVRLKDIDIKKPMTVEAKFSLDCST